MTTDEWRMMPVPISACWQCRSCARGNYTDLCEQRLIGSREIEDADVGFPDWCPLELAPLEDDDD